MKKSELKQLIKEVLTEQSDYVYEDAFDEFIKTPDYKAFQIQIKTFVNQLETKLKSLIDAKNVNFDEDNLEYGYSELFNDLIQKALKEVTY